jgi:hypothetical protein
VPHVSKLLRKLSWREEVDAGLVERVRDDNREQLLAFGNNFRHDPFPYHTFG